MRASCCAAAVGMALGGRKRVWDSCAIGAGFHFDVCGAKEVGGRNAALTGGLWHHLSQRGRASAVKCAMLDPRCLRSGAGGTSAESSVSLMRRRFDVPPASGL